MSQEERQELPKMEVAFQRGDTITEDGDVAGYPVIQVNDERVAGEPDADIRLPLPDAENGDSRSVNAVIPLSDLYEALAFLTREARP